MTHPFDGGQHRGYRCVRPMWNPGLGRPETCTRVETSPVHAEDPRGAVR